MIRFRNMKRKIPFLLFLFLSSLSVGQTTYYVSPTTASPAGNDANAGTIAAPWATLSYAISQVTTAGDTIHVNAGTYPAITTQMLLSNGVSLEGSGLPTIPLIWAGGEPCIKAETYGAWSNKTVGHHSISGIKFIGSTTAGSPIGIVAIGINFRHYVEIHDCWFEDFVKSAVTFIGEPAYSLDDDAGTRIDNPYETRTGVESVYLPYEDSFCVGNKFYNNEVHNCCGLEEATMYSGALEFSMQDGFLVYGNNMTALGRAGNGNGVPIKMIVGFNKNTKIHNNTINAGHKSQNYWQFAIEIWWNLGGLEVYDNVLNGSIDLCDSWDHYDVGYASRIYDNDIGYPTTTNDYDIGIIIEGSHIGDYIFRNKIHHVGKGIGINRNLYSTTTVHNGLYIFDNLMVELSGASYQTWGIYIDYNGVSDNSSVWKNWHIKHNTIVAKSDAPDPTYYGIVLPTVERFDSLFIENNILINWERGAIWGSMTRTTQTNFYIRNNLIYDSYNNNDPVYVNSYPTTGITYSGTVKADPLFVSSSDWHLSSTSSPAYHAGRDLDIATDYDGVAFHSTTPSIGAYEWPEESIPASSNLRGRATYNGRCVNYYGRRIKW